MITFYTYREKYCGDYRWDEEKSIKEEDIPKLIEKCSNPLYVGDMQIFKNYLIEGKIFSEVIYHY